MWHPWRNLGELEQLDVDWQDTDRIGCFDFRRMQITMATGMSQAERRSTLTHELVHVERGPVHRNWQDREEVLVERIAAHRLIPIEALGEAMAWTSDMSEVAEECWVDLPMLWARLESLTAEERTYLDRRLQHI